MSDIQSVIHHATMILRGDINNRRLCPRPVGLRSFCLNYDSRDAGGADWMQSRGMVPSFPRKRESVSARARTAWRHGRAAPLPPVGLPPFIRQAGTALPAGATPGPVKLTLTVDVVGHAEQHGGPALRRDLAGSVFDRIGLDEGRPALLAPLGILPAPLRYGVQQFRRRFVAQASAPPESRRRCAALPKAPARRPPTASPVPGSRPTAASPCPVSLCARSCGCL